MTTLSLPPCAAGFFFDSTDRPAQVANLPDKASQPVALAGRCMVIEWRAGRGISIGPGHRFHVRVSGIRRRSRRWFATFLPT